MTLRLGYTLRQWCHKMSTFFIFKLIVHVNHESNKFLRRIPSLCAIQGYWKQFKMIQNNLKTNNIGTNKSNNKNEMKAKAREGWVERGMLAFFSDL